MPFLSQDPYRRCFFVNIECPEEVIIPLKDYDAYQIFPKHRWIYNKLTIAEKQGLLCAPHGIKPPFFPVFSKPIYNLKSMGRESMPLFDSEDYTHHYAPGHMWSELLTGDHISTDMAVLKGRVVWQSHTRGLPLKGGTFDRWEVNIGIPDEHHTALVQFIESNFSGYTGMINAEMIGGKIIEGHLRFADQWPDLYPIGFLQSVIDLYRSHIWRPSEEMHRNEVKGHSVVLFGAPGRDYWTKPTDVQCKQIQDRYDGVTSISVTFLDKVLAQHHSMPPGGFRLACVNGHNLENCLKVRAELDALIRSINCDATGSAF